MVGKAGLLPLGIALSAIVSNLVLFALEGPVAWVLQPYGTLLGAAFFFAVFLFATFEALSIRRALAIRLYRNQALGVGLVALAYVILSAAQIGIATDLPANSPGPFGTPINYPFIYFTWLVLFYWIDASIRAARRSDPLLRDTLGWSKIRILVWALMIGSIIVTAAVVLYLVTATGLSVFAQATLPGVLSPQGVTGFFTFIFPLLVGGVYLPFATFRSRDPTLRRHLAWFGLFLLCLLGLLVTFNLPFSYAVAFAGSSLIVFGGYFLYRSARSLVPLNRISLMS